ncbi:MAG: hypothetical protein ACRDYC_12440, partial [Acidimicrobiales bacterium]
MAAFRVLWGFRVELLVIGAVVGGWFYANRALGPISASLAVGVPIVVLVALPASRHWAWRQLRFAGVQRRFASAVRTSRFDGAKLDRAPSVLKIRQTPAGFSMQVRVPPGTSVSDLDNAAEVVAAAMHVADIR